MIFHISFRCLLGFPPSPPINTFEYDLILFYREVISQSYLNQLFSNIETDMSRETERH